MRASVVLILTASALLLAVGTSASSQEIRYLAASGAPAKAFAQAQRPVADIVSPSRSTEKQRDAADESGQLAKLMDLKAGMIVGDIGAGSGYHTVRLSPLLGPSGRVIAQDVTRDYLRQLAGRIRRLKLRNVTLALGQPHDPRLPAGSLSGCFLTARCRRSQTACGDRTLQSCFALMRFGRICLCAFLQATRRTARAAGVRA